jgi:hypothetical protein
MVAAGFVKVGVGADDDEVPCLQQLIRNPRTHGWPERLPGSIVMREIILRAYHWASTSTSA